MIDFNGSLIISCSGVSMFISQPGTTTNGEFHHIAKSWFGILRWALRKGWLK